MNGATHRPAWTPNQLSCGRGPGYYQSVADASLKEHVPGLAEWRAEIESLSGGRVVTVPVETDSARNVLHIPPEFPGRALVRTLLLQESFVRQLIRSHALNVNYSGSAGRFHFILLNLALRNDWDGLEEAVLAHEYGHIWLNALGFASPRYEGEGCVATIAGDIVQHPLIFTETRKRGFAFDRFWIRNFERWLEQPRGGPADGCHNLILLSHWLDALVSLTDADWPNRRRLLAVFEQQRVELKHAADLLAKVVNAFDLWDRSLYEVVLRETITIVSAVHAGKTPSSALWYP